METIGSAACMEALSGAEQPLKTLAGIRARVTTNRSSRARDKGLGDSGFTGFRGFGFAGSWLRPKP